MADQINKIVLASKNPLKRKTVETVFQRLFPDQPFSLVQFDVEGNGPEPVGKEELLKEIDNHMNHSKRSYPGASFYVSMEGGVVDTEKGMEEIALVVIEDSDGNKSISSSVSFPIPEVVAVKVRSGMSFADAVNQAYLTEDIKNTTGFVGLLTDGIINKYDLYLQPTIIAFSKFKKINWFR